MNKSALLFSIGILLLCSFKTPKENSNTITKQHLNNQHKNNMETKNFTTQIIVDKSLHEVFNAINNVSAWWSENIQGGTTQLNDEFVYQYKSVHVCKLKIVEFIPDKKVVWLVLENQFDFTTDKNEWKGNKIVFELSEKAGKTHLDFTQIGLVPEYECYTICQDAWSSYIQGSLKNLITTGKGNPNTKENDLNKELIEKWGLPNKDNVQTKTNEQATKKGSFSYSFKTSKTADEVYELLLNIDQWWSGLFEENIEGKSKKINDEFSFKAGGGVHYSKQKLVELIPGKKIVWLVTDSNLSFLKAPSEWNGTKICFVISSDKNKTEITFTHEGLVPQIECYDSCSGAWNGYLDNLKKKLN